MKNKKVLQALMEFQDHLIANMGKPINLLTIGAYARMFAAIVEALNIKEDWTHRMEIYVKQNGKRIKRIYTRIITK